jgi:hypothetical protein
MSAFSVTIMSLTRVDYFDSISVVNFSTYFIIPLLICLALCVVLLFNLVYHTALKAGRLRLQATKNKCQRNLVSCSPFVG